MDEILDFLKKWNQQQQLEMQKEWDQIWKNQQRIYSLKEEKENSFFFIKQFFKMKYLQFQNKQIQKKRKSKNEKYFLSFHTFQELDRMNSFKNVILNEKDYNDAYYCYQCLKELEHNLSFIKEKKKVCFSKKECQKIQNEMKEFERKIQNRDYFIYYLNSIPTSMTVKEEYLTFDHYKLISSYGNYGDILKDCLNKMGYHYETYFFLVQILYSFKNYHFEKERDEDLKENPLYLIKRDPLSVLYFNNEDLKMIRKELLKELQSRHEMHETDYDNMEALKTMEDCILSRTKGVKKNG